MRSDGRLAAAGRADQDQELLVLDVQVEVGDRGEAVVLLPDVIEGDGRHQVLPLGLAVPSRTHASCRRGGLGRIPYVVRREVSASYRTSAVPDRPDRHAIVQSRRATSHPAHARDALNVQVRVPVAPAAGSG